MLLVELDFSPDRRQRYLYVIDRTNQVVWVVDRASEEVLTRFGRPGRNAGMLHWADTIRVDSRGNVYTAEVDSGKRARKFHVRGHRAVR